MNLYTEKRIINCIVIKLLFECMINKMVFFSEMLNQNFETKDKVKFKIIFNIVFVLI